MPAVRGPGAASKSSGGHYRNSRPLRRVRHRPGRQRHPLSCSHPSLALMESLELLEEWRRAGQLPLLCPCGKPVQLKRLGCCRACYARRQHSLRFFGGLRERVVRRDRFCCQGCGVKSRLVVHHRSQDNHDDALITLCIRCHVRIHRWRCLHHWAPGVLMKLWSELHRDAPVQLQLQFIPVIPIPHDCGTMSRSRSHSGQDGPARRVSTVMDDDAAIADYRFRCRRRL